MNIEIIAGSPRKPSLSQRVAKYLYERLSKEWQEANIGLISMNEIEVTPIQKVWKSSQDAPQELQTIAERIFNADAYILVSPEYNGGYSPAMKNLLDHFPKRNRKVFGICTSSDGRMGGMRAAQQLLQLVPALFGIASPMLLIVPEVDKKFDENGVLTDDTFQSAIDNFIAEFKWLAEKISR